MPHPSTEDPQLLLPKTLPNIHPTPLPKLLRILPPQPRRLHIRRTLVVRTTQHANDAQEYCFGRLNRRPSFAGRFVPVWIVGRGMEDRDADVAGGVYCISPHEIFSRDLVVGEREKERERERWVIPLGWNIGV